MEGHNYFCYVPLLIAEGHNRFFIPLLILFKSISGFSAYRIRFVTARIRSMGTVMFSHVSVILFMGGSVFPQCHGKADPQERQTPASRGKQADPPPPPPTGKQADPPPPQVSRQIPLQVSRQIPPPQVSRQTPQVSRQIPPPPFITCTTGYDHTCFDILFAFIDMFTNISLQ